MKKQFYYSLVLALLLFARLGHAQITVGVAPSVQCFVANASVAVSASTPSTGITSYSWGVVAPSPAAAATVTMAATVTTGSVNTISYNACGVYTVYCWLYSGATYMGYSAATHTLSCGPTINISTTSTTLCPGGTATLTAAGGNTYTWMPGNLSGSAIVVSPTANTCYTVVGSSTACANSAGALQCINVSVPNVNISGAPSICNGGFTTLYGTGASSYSWSTGATTSFISVISPGCYTVVGSNGSCTNSAVHCLSVAPTPTVTAITATNSICAGSAVVFTLNGAGGYTITPGFVTNSAIASSSAVTATLAVYPASNTVYTIQGYFAPVYCPGYTSVAINVSPNPTVVITGGGSICAGSAATLAASGAASYSWFPGNISGPSIAVSPTAATCYTVVGASAAGCVGNAVSCINVNPNPNVTISGNSTVCAGVYNPLTASGASSYAWSIGAATPVINGNASTCYSVTGTNAFGCTGIAVHCVTVIPGPGITLSSIDTICVGSSVNFTASGASSYVWKLFTSSWSVIATTATVSVPTTTASPYLLDFYVIGTNGSGCTDSIERAVIVHTNCAQVWPGDANSDGVVNSSDVIELGLAYNNTGAARASVSNVYSAQLASTWSGTGSTGANQCHVDCNGDGTINDNDTLAIYNNYSLTHSFRPSGAASVSDISYDASAYLEAGQWNTINILLGDNANTISQLYGLTFDVNFDASLVETNMAYLSYSSSFLNASNHNVQFRKLDFPAGKIMAASVRTDGNNVNGNGVIAELHLKLKPDAAGNNLNLSFSNSEKVNHSGTPAALNNNPSVLEVHAANPVGIRVNNLSAASVQLFPNPASSQVTLHSYVAGEMSYTVVDLSGRTIVNGAFSGSKTIGLGQFDNGIYIVKIESASGSVFKKLVIEK